MSQKIRQDALSGSLSLLVLKTLAAGPLHGYGIASRIHQLSEELLKVEEGSLYPALHRMEQEGLVTSDWGLTETNRRARFYRLTPQGAAQLNAESENWQRVSRGIQLVLQSA